MLTNVSWVTFTVTGLYWLLTLSVIARVLARRRPVSAALAWILVIALIPVAGMIAYLLLGELSLGRRRERLAEAMSSHHLVVNPRDRDRKPTAEPPTPATPVAFAVQQMLHHQLGLGTLPHVGLRPLATPDDVFDSLLADINRAEESIRMEFYIWYPGKRVDAIADALTTAAARGIDIEILIDHAGSRPFFRSDQFNQLKAAGIKVVPALPVRLWRFMFRRLDLRLHRKLVVIDHQIAYTGSMNMADPDCFERERNLGPWVDLMLRIEGEAAQALSRVFSWDWEVETGERSLPHWYLDPRPPLGSLSVIPSGPGLGDDMIEQAVLASVYRADHCIQICTPYFVPSEELFEALCHAAKRQVRIELIVPRENNSWLVHWASRSYYEPLLRLGAQIFRFDGGLLHTKALLVDNELALVGSVNLDVRSLQLNFELSVALFNESTTHLIQPLFDDYLRQSEPIEPEEWHRRPLRHRVLERLMFFLSPLL